MKLRHLKTLLTSQPGVHRVQALAWSHNNTRLAVCTADCVISLFDDSGERRDKFSTKPVDARYGKRSYVVTGLVFSPDNTRLAVGQSDCIVFVYRLGDEWGDKKAICNRFAQNAPVTCLAWPLHGPLVCGLLDGRVRGASVRSGKCHTLYHADAAAVCVTSNGAGTAIAAAHADGAVVRWHVARDEGGSDTGGRLLRHPVPPAAICWPGRHLLVVGCDRRVVLYGDDDGRLQQQFDYSRRSGQKAFTTAAANSSGQAAVVGSFDQLLVLVCSGSVWREVSECRLQRLYTVTALAWRRDGSRLVCAGLSGGVELFDTALRRSVWNNSWEVTHVGASQVLIKPLTGSARGVMLKSQFGHEITDLRFMGGDRYLVARTDETLLVGDLTRNLLSEVAWSSSDRSEKFYLENTGCCVVFTPGEFSLIEYGNNEILGSFRSSFFNPFLMSIRINERSGRQNGDDNKKIAFLIDCKTITVVDLTFGTNIGVFVHQTRIDWLELNETGSRLLFRDRRLRLHLADLHSQTVRVLISGCGFVQWVPGSDVVVAQSGRDLCIWYHVDSPERVNAVPVEGEVVAVDREQGRAEVVVQHGRQQVRYQLDAALIEFGTAVEDGDLCRAVAYLQSLPLSAEVEAMWSTLARVALDTIQLHVADRCLAALGDVAKLRFVGGLLNRIESSQGENGSGGGSEVELFEVKARLAQLHGNFGEAESLLVENGRVDEALAMYRRVDLWPELLSLARRCHHRDADLLQQQFRRWLTDTRQMEQAAILHEQDGEHVQAVHAYLDAGLPARAARVALNQVSMDRSLLENICSVLKAADLLEPAGEVLRRLGEPSAALECFRSARAFSRAIALARDCFADQVVDLEEEWGDHLRSQHEPDAAINHFIEAGKISKALDAAVHSRQWKKALQIIEARTEYHGLIDNIVIVADHCAEARNYPTAEKLFLCVGEHQRAIEMYNACGKWDRAHEIALFHLQPSEVERMYIEQASHMEAEGKFSEAEKLYVTVQQPDLAIAMYKKCSQYEDMLRLVGEHHPELVVPTHQLLGRQLEADGQLSQAEHHYSAAGDWKAAIQMWRTADSWEDAFRVSQLSGSEEAPGQVALLWATAVGGGRAARVLLQRIGYLETCVDLAVQRRQFELAFQLAEGYSEQKLLGIRYKHAMALEDEGRFSEAEKSFIASGRSREAVLMYVHGEQWADAQRVAEQYDADSLPDILVGQARQAFSAGDTVNAEALLLRAGNSELAVQLYREAGRWQDAIRVCRQYAPHLMTELQQQKQRDTSASLDTSDVTALVSRAAHWQQLGQYEKAIDCYRQVDKCGSEDAQALERAWTSAADLAVQYVGGDEGVQVASEMAGRLTDIGRHRSAAQVLLVAGLTGPAVEALMRAGDWQRARQLAAELGSDAVHGVDQQRRETLRSEQRLAELASNDIEETLRVLADQGQWAQCLEIAERQGSGVLQRYLLLYIDQLIRGRQFIEVLHLLVRHQCPATAHGVRLACAMACGLWRQYASSSSQDYTDLAKIRDCLADLSGRTRSSGLSDTDKLEKHVLISHLLAARAAYREVQHMHSQAASVSISMLRYLEYLPSDWVFYEAGAAAVQLNWNNAAFVFWNHLLDICEAIDDNNPDAVDYSFLALTDIPVHHALPDIRSVSDGQVEEAREWVLSMSMDEKVERRLPVESGRSVFVSSLRNADGSLESPCLVTGMPVTGDCVRFHSEKLADKDAWNSLLMASRLSNNVNLTDVLKFVSTWADNGQQNFSFQQ